MICKGHSPEKMTVMLLIDPLSLQNKNHQSNWWDCTDTAWLSQDHLALIRFPQRPLFAWGLDGQDLLKALQLTALCNLFVEPSDFQALRFLSNISLCIWQSMATTTHQSHSLGFESIICQSWLKSTYSLWGLLLVLVNNKSMTVVI